MVSEAYGIDMMEALTAMLAFLFKNSLGQWPHQYMIPEGFLILGIPAIAGFMGYGVVGGLLFGAPLITVLIIQRFAPI